MLINCISLNEQCALSEPRADDHWIPPILIHLKLHLSENKSKQQGFDFSL